MSEKIEKLSRGVIKAVKGDHIVVKSHGELIEIPRLCKGDVVVAMMGSLALSAPMREALVRHQQEVMLKKVTSGLELA